MAIDMAPIIQNTFLLLFILPSLPKAERDITLSTFVPQDIRDRHPAAF
jgi:hypothetical protein